MKTLTKVKLINWHSFENEDFPIYHNVLLTGENGTGKSTILDAIQYVLTVGKCRFNRAASDIGNRSLESYMRLKTGKEGNEYVRNSDVTTYIALEFYDEKIKRSDIIGTVIDLRAGGKPIREFFHITNAKIKDNYFIDNRRVLTKKQFKNNLSHLSLQTTFKDSQKDAQRLFQNVLGVKEKYFELVSKGLAFKAIDNVYQFIMDFLLKEDNVNINDLRESIHHYQRLEEKLKESESECCFLNGIVDQYEQYEQSHRRIDILRVVLDKITIKQLLHLIETDNKEMNRLNSLSRYYQSKIIALRQNIDTYSKQKTQLEYSMNENESYKLKEQLKREIDDLSKNEIKLKQTYQLIKNDIEKEAELLKKLRVQRKFIEYVHSDILMSDELQEYLNEIINYVSLEKDNTSQFLIENRRMLENYGNEYNDKLTVYNSLEKNQMIYKIEVQELIDLLKEKLFERYGKHVDVKPLCEYIEVKDEIWRNALEGYLNTQRFDLIVEPEYFEYSLQVYEQYKNKKGIYGVGIVDVAKLKKYESYDISGSLAEKIISKNAYASWYVIMLLHRVKCVDDVRMLRHYKVAITPSAMLYKNYSVKALNPKIYKKPFIGLAAIDIQKQSLENELVELKCTIEVAKKEYHEVKKKNELLQSSKADQILFKINIIDEYHDIKESLNVLNERYKKLKLDDSILAMQEEYDDISLKIKSLQKEYELLVGENQVRENTIHQLNERLIMNKNSHETMTEAMIQFETNHIDIASQADEKIEEYYKKFFKQYDAAKKSITDEINRKEKDLLSYEHNIVTEMKNYNNQYNVGFENAISSIDQYKNRFYILRDLDISTKKRKTLDAKLKCEESFKTSFISGLAEKIRNARDDIDQLNKGLAKRDFNGEKYEFCVSPTKKDHFKDYYRIIVSGKEYQSDDLLSDILDDSQRRVMDELFAKLSNSYNNKDTEKMLVEYTDYRNYLDYDIKIMYNDGSVSYFSKVNKEKSGGETQTPFYVIMAASFEQVINVRKNEDFGCVVIFDEAFNNMDEHRIQEMIKFYNEREIQTFIAVPPSRASTIIPYVNTRLLIIKDNNRSFVEVIRDEEL